jgi:hypothetical protein
MEVFINLVIDFRKIALLATLFFVAPLHAVPNAVVQLTSQGTSVNWPIQARWGWKKNSDGAIVLFASAKISVPKGVKVAKSLSSTLRLSVNEETLHIQSGALKGRFELVLGDGVHAYELNISPPKPSLIVADCETFGLSFNIKLQNLPFFLGARCVLIGDKYKGKAQLHLTIPEEADIDQSTLFEQKGKGESWRIYDLGRNDSGTAENGKIVLRYKDKSYDLILNWSTKFKEDSKIKPPFEKDFAFGLGYSMVKLQASAAGPSSSSSSQYFARLKLLPNLVWNKIGFGVDLDANFAIAQSINAINTLQFAPYVFYRLLQTSRLILDPRLYFVMTSEQQSGSGSGFNTSQLGLGLMAALQVNKNWQTHADFVTESFGSKVIQSHYALDLGLNEIGRDRRFRWGGGIVVQSFKVKDALGNSYAFGQNSLYGLMLF